MSSEISDLLLFVSYFSSQSNGTKLGDNFFDVFYVVACRGLVMSGASAWLYASQPNSSIDQWRMVVIVTG